MSRPGKRRHRRPPARQQGVLAAACVPTGPRKPDCWPRRPARSTGRPGGTPLRSGGKPRLGKQRIVEIARALCSDPCLLLLDEPAAGLRYLEKQALAELLGKLRAEGMGILLVEHDMDFVMGLADRVVVMEFGEKIAEGCWKPCSATQGTRSLPGGSTKMSRHPHLHDNEVILEVRDLRVRLRQGRGPCTRSA